MPIWWDDMGVYLNLPRMIAENSSPLAWWKMPYYYLSTLWFVLWPQYVWATVWMFFSWFWWLLWMIAVFVFVRRFFNERMALFASTYYYLMPMITFQSALDMKMDPPLFLFMVVSALVLFDKSHSLLDKINDITHRISREDMIKWWIWWFLLSFAYLMKPTTWMEIFAIMALGMFFLFNWKTALWIIFLQMSVFLIKFAQIPEFTQEMTYIFASIFAIIWIIFILISKIQKYQLIHLKDIVISAWLWFILLYAPWYWLDHFARQSISDYTFNIDLNTIWIDKEWKDEEYCRSTWGTEELERYIWYWQSFSEKYLTLPWKNTMNTEVHWYYLDIWFLYLAIIPWIFLLWLYRRWWKKEWWILVLFCVNWFFWAFAANWVPWYWLFWFLPALILVWMVMFDKNLNEDYFNRYLFLWLVFISFLSFSILRETKTWNPSVLRYAFWIKNAEETVDTVVPSYRETSKIIASVPHTKETPNYVYRVGTFITYFIKDSNKVLYNDSQLDIFSCIDNKFWKDDKKLLNALRELWFRFIVFDTNTQTIEKDPNWTLHKKVQRFVQWANDNTKIVYSKPKQGIAFMIIPTEDESVKMDAVKNANNKSWSEVTNTGSESTWSNK